MFIIAKKNNIKVQRDLGRKSLTHFYYIDLELLAYIIIIKLKLKIIVRERQDNP